MMFGPTVPKTNEERRSELISVLDEVLDILDEDYDGGSLLSLSSTSTTSYSRRNCNQ